MAAAMATAVEETLSPREPHYAPRAGGAHASHRTAGIAGRTGRRGGVAARGARAGGHAALFVDPVLLGEAKPHRALVRDRHARP